MNLAGKPLAITFMAIGGSLIALAGWIIWDSVQKRMAIGHLQTAVTKSFSGDPRSARSEAADAVSWLSDEPSAVLAAADLSSPAAADRLLQLARQTRGDAQQALLAGAALAQRKAPEGAELNPSDAALIRAISTQDTANYQLDAQSPPHRAVLAAWAAMRLQAAWKAGRKDAVQDAAATLLTVLPRHAQAAELTLVVAALSSNATTGKLIAAASGIADIKRRNQLVTSLIALAPEQTELTKLLPGNDGLSPGEVALKRRVDAALIDPDRITDVLVAQCLQLNKPDLAEKLAGRSDTAKRAQLQALPKIIDGSGFSDDGARITTPVATGGNVTFHVSNRAGDLPIKPISVTLGTNPVPETMMTRMGTLISVPLKIHGSMSVTVAYDGAAIWSGMLNL